MEKEEDIKKKRPRDAGVDGLGKMARVGETRKPEDEDEDEVEEFFAILRRMHGALKYFERASGDSRRRGPATWRAALETGAEAEKETPEVEPGRDRAVVVPDLNALPEESRGRDGAEVQEQNLV